MTARRDCTEESFAGICHMRASPSVGETPQQFVLLFVLFSFFSFVRVGFFLTKKLFWSSSRRYRMVRFEYPVQYPMDHLSRPVRHSLVRLLCYFLHSLVMWLTVSSLSPHNLRLLSCYALSIFDGIIIIIIITVIITSWEFSHQCKLMVFHWGNNALASW